MTSLLRAAHLAESLIVPQSCANEGTVDRIAASPEIGVAEPLEEIALVPAFARFHTLEHRRCEPRIAPFAHRFPGASESVGRPYSSQAFGSCHFELQPAAGGGTSGVTKAVE